jgi:lipoprotein-anchoring transpeptidase ErfK/SrfK
LVLSVIRRILASLALAIGLTTLSTGVAASALRIFVDVSMQQMWIEQSGTMIYLGRVSTARRGFRTPRGVFRAVRLERVWYSTRYDGSPMPYSIFFHIGYAIHGTLEARKLGRPVSHGCIRISVANAQRLFELVRSKGLRNTIIIVRS